MRWSGGQPGLSVIDAAGFGLGTPDSSWSWTGRARRPNTAHAVVSMAPLLAENALKNQNEARQELARGKGGCFCEKILNKKVERFKRLKRLAKCAAISTPADFRGRAARDPTHERV
jgi:hypothetical protein